MHVVSARVPGSSSSTARSRPDGHLERAEAARRRASSSSSPSGRATRRTLLDAIDFDVQAEELAGLLEPGDHLAAHSYGAVVSLLAAARAPLASLTVVEPPAFGVARGDPAVEAFLAHFEARPEGSARVSRVLPPLVGSSLNLRTPAAAIEAGARAAIAAPPEASIPLDELAATPFPKLVVSGRTNARLRCCLRRPRGTPRRAARGTPGAGTRSHASASRSTRCWRRSSRAGGSALALGLFAPAAATIRQLDDLEDVDDVDRERDRDEADRRASAATGASRPSRNGTEPERRELRRHAPGVHRQRRAPLREASPQEAGRCDWSAA